MLHRVEGEGLVIITQPAHAWLSGQLARHWGNGQFGSFTPGEEVCLAATLHDIGFLDWEQSPTLNPQTGLPHTFLDLPTATHLEIWSTGITQMLRYGRYPALLVSQHFTWLCKLHPAKSSADRRLERKFVEEQTELQTTLTISLQNDFYYESFSAEEIILRNRRLISLWDWLSLLLCTGFRGEQLVENVPTAEDVTTITLKPLNEGATRVAVSPWPFGSESLSVICESRHLLKRYASEDEMRAAILAASPVPLQIELVRE
ncbi:MAG: hypothetical protein JWR19_757 [Pedosphaera sp.]|nr:hypothetical protein [Pedosphaera sp.]